MKIAVIGSRNLYVDDVCLAKYLSKAEEIISGGAKGIDRCAAEYAKKNNIGLTELLPEYELYGRVAPIIRNYRIVDCADKVIAFWDGASKGTLSVIKYAKKINKECEIIVINKSDLLCTEKNT